MNDIKIFLNKDDAFYCHRLDGNQTYFIGFGDSTQNIFMIIFSFLGIFINLYFFVISIRRIINSKKLEKVNVSSIDKILCVISIVETCISICWLINLFAMETTKEEEDHCDTCRTIGTIELFLYLFDLMILSSILFQIKKMLIHPLENLKADNIYRYIIFCAIFGILNAIFGVYADVEGVSPMLTCFIDVVGWEYDNKNEKIIGTIFYIMFFLIPICILLLGIYKVYEIRKLPQFINNKKNRRFFRSYLQYILVYIVLALLLISVYVIDYFNEQTEPNGILRIYFIIVTNLFCGMPLIVGIIRLIKTKSIKNIFFCINKSRKNNDIDYCKDEILNEGLRNSMSTTDYQFVNFEQELICKEFQKIFIGISYILDKSNQLNIEEENEKDDEKNEEELNLLNTNDKDNDINYNEIDIDNYYIINKQEILKNFDLNINEDRFVLDQEEINIEATEYFPNYFKNNRKLDNLEEVELVKYFQPKDVLPDLFKKTSDSNYYINSSNKQFILKSINLEQIDFYKKTIKKGKINEYLEKNSDSLINRVYGLYHLKIDNNKEYYIALMENIY